MLVSVLIPCFNAERWVAEAIESALAQTWSEKEVIVVDDGSTDRSLEVIKRFSDRVRWEAKPHSGGNVARNHLLHLARGEWLQYLDADDYLLPPKIERQMGFLHGHPECDVIYSPVIFANSTQGRVTRKESHISEPHDPWVLLARWWLPQTGGPLWKKRTLISVGGWKPDQPCCQEHELYLRLLQAGAQFCYFEQSHAVYRHWSSTETVSKRNPAEVRSRRLEVMDRMDVFLKSRGELTPNRLNALNQARFEIARSAWSDDPAKAQEIVEGIEQSQSGFVPEPPIAPARYRLVYKTLGFHAAERLASCARRFTGRTTT